MIIEQTKEQMHEAVSLHVNASIEWIRLARSNAWSLSPDQISEVGKPVLDISFKPMSFRSHECWLTFDTGFSFRILSDLPSSEPVLVVECQFEARYRLDPGFDPSERQIEAFQAANAVFNCWPFFREYVQSTATRMNVPPPPVPFLRIVRKRETSLAQPETQLGPAGAEVPAKPAAPNGREKLRRRKRRNINT